MRGGGRHKGNSSKSEKKRTTKSERPEQKSDEDPEMKSMDEAMRRLEEDEVYQENIECMSEGSEGEVQQKVQNYLAQMQKVSWMNKEQHELLESGVWRAVEARRKGRGEEQEQRRQEEPEQRRQHEQEQKEQPEQKERRQEQGEQRRLAAQEHNTGQEQSKQGKQVRFGEEEQLGETRAESTDEPEVTGRTTEVRTGRGSAGLVRGGDERRWTDETSRRGKGKGNGGKREHESKGGGFGKGKQQETKEREEERDRVAPNMGAGGSHLQATSDPGEREMAEEERNPRDEMG